MSDNSEQLGRVANNAYHYFGGGYSHQRDAFERGFQEGVKYALNYAKKVEDMPPLLEVRPLPGCAFPDPFKDRSESNDR